MAQEAILGMVATSKHEPLVGATVQVLGTDKGTITDVDGRFEISASNGDRLIVSFVGFDTDTVEAETGKMMHIMINESAEELGEVVVSSGSTFFDNMESKNLEIITEKELLKAACCNLSESFETNASVDVSLTDAVSGAKMIRMLGLDGKYVQINRENIPHVRGLTNRYGLGFVPGTWIQSIDVGKGAGTVVNGYESMTGQINLEFKKPENSEKLYLNSYINSFGRFELNGNRARDLNEKWSTGILAHADYFGSEIDQNDDGFMDRPKSRQINVLKRFKYNGERIVGQFGLNVMRDEKAGGQTGFDFGDDHKTSPEYGFVNNTTRIEAYGKTGILFLDKPYKGWGFLYSASFQDMDGGFGREPYDGKETTLYFNAINQNIIGNSFHQYKTGFSVLYDDFKESYSSLNLNRQEIVPGGYFEYSYLPNDNFTMVAGLRYDHHNLYGSYWTPRLHLRYQSGKNTVWRASAGRGYRTPNVLMDNLPMLFSSRNISITEEIKPEVSWNSGASVTSEIALFNTPVEVAIDYFHTYFENQLIADMDASFTEVFLYNLRGRSYAHNYQTQLNFKLSEKLSTRVAYKYYDVKTTYSGVLRRPPFIPKNRFFINTAYATKYEKWKIDGTLQWRGKGRFPDMSNHPITDVTFDTETPSYFLLNGQISRGFRWGNIYLGSENLLNFRQKNPIVDPENPFGTNFDASMIWGPVTGTMVYAGFRYKVKRK